MYQKMGLSCSDASDLMEFDLNNLLDSSVDFTPTAMIQMEDTLLSLDGTYDDDSDSDSVSDDSNQEWTSPSSTSLARQSRRNLKVTASGQPRQLPGPKSSRRLEDMTPQEVARRQRRRERNKAAAARCRQRRLDLTNQLLTETQQLETESQRLECEIENLRKQRDQLQFVLEAHQPACNLFDAPAESTVTVQCVANVGTGAAVMSMNTMSVTRPNSLPIACSLTPSSAFSVEGFDLGSTGVTPVVSASGFNLFMGTGADYMSPTTLLGSPAYSM